MKRSTTFLIAAALVSVACSGSGPQSGGSSGIAGQVVAGPQCPLEIQGSPCPDQPVAGMVIATSASGKTFGIRSDDQGRFKLALRPGTYTVTARELGDNPRLTKPVTVTVEAGRFSTVSIVVDTGIR